MTRWDYRTDTKQWQQRPLDALYPVVYLDCLVVRSHDSGVVQGAIESLNASLRKITKTRRSFPTDDSVMKILYLALHQISKKWTMPIRDWKAAMSQFMIMYSDRVSL